MILLLLPILTTKKLSARTRIMVQQIHLVILALHTRMDSQDGAPDMMLQHRCLIHAQCAAHANLLQSARPVQMVAPQMAAAQMVAAQTAIAQVMTVQVAQVIVDARLATNVKPKMSPISTTTSSASPLMNLH